MPAAVALDPSAITAALTADELGQTVEEYLRGQCGQRVKSLKRHMDERISEFEEGVKRGRQALVEIANPATEEAPVVTTEEGPLCDPFALVAIRGPRSGEIFKVEPTDSQKLWKIGRDKAADLSLAGDDEVSSAHAQISFDRKQFKLMDLGSTNGCYVNGDRIEAQRYVELLEKDCLRFGYSSREYVLLNADKDGQ
jgi:hypothetical protein